MIPTFVILHIANDISVKAGHDYNKFQFLDHF